MTRLARDRDTHLTPEEIAAEALRQFDGDGGEPSIRSLAAALHVAPSAIYHHFPSREAIFQAAVELVWGEATVELLRLVPEPLTADPEKVLVATGIATRRAWLAHYYLAPYMAASPEPTEFMKNALALMANLFERLGLEGEEAVTAFHSYSAFMIGAVLFTATRAAANERLARERARSKSQPPRAGDGLASDRSRLSVDTAMEAAMDPLRDEMLFAEGLSRLVRSFG